VPDLPDLSVLRGARARLDGRRGDVIRSQATLAARVAALARARRVSASDPDRVTRAAADREAARRALRDARVAERAARAAFVDELTAWLGPDPAVDVARLSAAYPIVLLPVRIETRFAALGGDGDRAGELRVRIYPDDIAADTHEPELTVEERAAGERFWTAAWDAAREQEAWAALLASPYPAPRAAWICRTTAPTNLAARPAGAPQFPDPPARAATWSRAGEARVLPDRWVVICSRNDVEVRRAYSGAVADPLPLTLSPIADPDDPVDPADPTGPGDVVDISGDGLRLDRDVEWTVRFDAALAAGMAVRVPLDARDLQLGFDRVLVLGVKASLGPDQGGERLAALLDAHHFARGLALLRAGTPTNNTTGQPSGFPPDDPGGTRSFAVERLVPRARPGTVGRQLADALGIPAAVMDHVDGADRREHDWAAAMNEVLWPVTLGYFMAQMMDPLVDGSAILAARAHFITHVRGRGPLPAFRVGAVPYGVLPVSSVAAWEPRADAAGAERHLPRIVRELRGRWLAQVRRVARIGRSLDRDRDLVDVLAMDASAREVWIRTVMGPDAEANLSVLLGISNSEALRQWRQAIAGALIVQLAAALGRPVDAETERPRVIDAVFADEAQRFAHALVTDAPVSEERPLDVNYLRWIGREASLAQLVLERFTAGVPHPTALLYRMVRHALLTLYGDAATEIRVRTGLTPQAERREPELIAIVPGTEARTTVWNRLEEPVPAVSGTVPLGEFLRQTATSVRVADESGLTPTDLSVAVARAPESLFVASFLRALAVLEPLATAELERLFTETLDTCSHRLDAWITSLASQRLRRMRTANPAGAHLGAYGWVEDLRPAPPAELRPLPGGGTAVVQPNSGGYVHAPSMNHAAAAAVLRNAYLTRAAGGTGDAYAIDLSSARVRLARWLLDSVRQGQSLRAVGGYLFERGLHEGHRPLELDRFIEVFRARFPLPERNDPAQPPVAGEALSPRDVVDGEALRAAWRERRIRPGAGGIVIGSETIAATAGEQDAIGAELNALDGVLDAVADALVADSVYELVRGSTTAAAASLDALARGGRPPDPAVTRAPRGGTALTHRVAVVLGGAPVAAPGWESIADTPRAAAEPYLDRWVGALLGDPAQVRCRVDLPDPTDAAPDRRREVTVTLAQLGLRPLDVLALARTPGPSAPASAIGTPAAGPLVPGAELERRVVDAASAGAPRLGSARVLFERIATWDPRTVRTFPEILELARVINAVLGGARALRPADVLAKDSAPLAAGADLLPDEAAARATAAVDALRSARDDLDTALAAVTPPAPGDPEPDLGPVRVALRRAALFRAATYPAPGPRDAPTRQALMASGLAASAELTRRLTSAGGAATPADRVAKVFGRDFLFLPRFVPAGATELASALAYGPTLAPSDDDKLRWLQQAARVRASLGRWRTLALYAGCLGAPLPVFDVAQLPHADGARWVALPFAPGDRPTSDRVSLDLHRVVAPAATAPWAGILLDEWSETIPAMSESTGVAVHYDDPGAEAAQAVLIAVPPTSAATWDLATLEAILTETLELAKIRAVDFEVLGDYAQLLPAIYLAANAANDTVSTDFAGARIRATGLAGG
jgi:hypothetical protein